MYEIIKYLKLKQFKWFVFYSYLLPINIVFGQLAPGIDFPISNGTLIYHPRSNAVLLAGTHSRVPNPIQSDVWKWDGQKWSKINAEGPGSRDFFKGALNTKTGNLQFFGGFDAEEKRKGDMWLFDGLQWVKVNTNPIGTHDHHNMVYMDHLDAFLVYGGNINGYPNYDTTTWICKDNNFTKLNIPGPGFRWHYGMVYDKNRKKVVLYGGGEKPDEHWEFDGKNWTKIETQVNPGRRLYHAMAYNEDRKITVLHGGWINQDPRDPVNSEPHTTWTWDGKLWKQIAWENIFATSMAYDPSRKVIVAFGHVEKSSDSPWALWELKNDQWNKIVEFGVSKK